VYGIGRGNAKGFESAFWVMHVSLAVKISLSYNKAMVWDILDG
jgi:hypothetical protein